MGMMGNKGGVSIRVQFYDSTLCFVNSHLAAHRENVAGRNADFVNVLSKLSFDVGEDSVRETIRNGSMSQWASGSSSVGIADHDIVFWIGDLNYRIDESLPTERILFLSEAGKIEELRGLDQLNIERREGRVFQGFEEDKLTSLQPTSISLELIPTSRDRRRSCVLRLGAIVFCGWRKILVMYSNCPISEVRRQIFPITNQSFQRCESLLRM